MRNRKVQREVRRMIGREEKIGLADYCGVKDPTPYEAVNNLIRKERAEAIAKAKMIVAAQRT